MSLNACAKQIGMAALLAFIKMPVEAQEQRSTVCMTEAFRAELEVVLRLLGEGIAVARGP